MKRPLYNAVQSLLHNRRHFISALCVRLSFLFSDKRYLKIQHCLIFRKQLDLDNPVTYNEKLQWLKLYNHRPEYTTMADKVKVKQYVAERIGEQYVVPLLGVWDRPEEIEWDKLPEKFVLKTNHDGGSYGVVVCKDKENFDQDKAIKRLKASLKRNTYLLGREWPYKNIQRRVLAEQFIEGDETGELPDCKFFCFDGKVKLLYLVTHDKTGLQFDYYDEDFNLLDLERMYPNSVKKQAKPIHFELMKELAEKLSEGIPHVRVDFFESNNKVYFSEFTFFPSGGWAAFHPEEWDLKLGQYIQLPEKYGV